MDTRNGLGGTTGKLATDHTDADHCGRGPGCLRSSGITAVELNVTLTDSVGNGYLSVYPDGAPRPAPSNMNWFGNLLEAENVIVPVGANGKVDLYNGGMPGTRRERIFQRLRREPLRPRHPYPHPRHAPEWRPRRGERRGGSVALHLWHGRDRDGVRRQRHRDPDGDRGPAGREPYGTPITTSNVNWMSANATAANLAISPLGAGALHSYNGGPGARPVQEIAALGGRFAAG
jgi:hypothetical protein